MNRVTLEVAVETVEDAVAAAAGGADRLELSAALDLGGLTPSVGAVLEVLAAVKLPVVLMIRPRPGDFVYSDADFRVMCRDIELFRQYRPAGFVFGMLTDAGAVDAASCERLLDLAAGVPCVFHRAFDRCPDPLAAIDALAELKFARVLTSGRESTALQGSQNIAKVRKHVGDRVTLLPCGKVRAENAATVLAVTGCGEVHGSFAEPVPEAGGVGRRGYERRSRTGQPLVAAARAAIDAHAEGERPA